MAFPAASITSYVYRIWAHLSEQGSRKCEQNKGGHQDCKTQDEKFGNGEDGMGFLIQGNQQRPKARRD
jgi:hypothetical protein